MKYPAELYRKAEMILQKRRLAAQMEQRSRKDDIEANQPGVFAKLQEINLLGATAGKEIITAKPADVSKLVNRLKRQEKALQAELAQSLQVAGLPADYLEIQYRCNECEDTGFNNGKGCTCRQRILNRLAYEWLSNTCDIERCSFDNFALEYYTGQNKTAMQKLVTSSKRFAENFNHDSPNLLFEGGPGLGKTHLSLAIAKEVVQRGHLVVYATAASMIDRLVDISFGQVADTDEYRSTVYNCDLLIIDDLGTEFQTRFTKSEVYNIINSRYMAKRPTIINTNLSIKDIERQYDGRIASRLGNDYINNHFTGQDIRYTRRISKARPKPAP